MVTSTTLPKIIHSKKMKVTIEPGAGMPRAEFIGRGMVYDTPDRPGGYSLSYEIFELEIYDSLGRRVGLPAHYLAALLSKYSEEIESKFTSAIEKDYLKSDRR